MRNLRSDGDGVYTGRLDAGVWQLEAYHGDSGCFLLYPAELKVEACQEVLFDLHLDACSG